MAETIDDMLILLRDVTQHQELSESDALDEINGFYRNQFHVDIGMKAINTMWNFQTLKDTSEYTVPESYRLINSNEVFINNNVIDLYFDKVLFEQYFPDAYTLDESIGSGDGTETTFSGTLANYPVVPKSLVADDDIETFKDIEGTGTLTGSLGGSGTIVYSTGVYSVTFYTAPTDGQAIVATYADYTAAQPDAALCYGGVIKFSPVPDATYDVNIQVAKRPVALTSAGTIPHPIWGDAVVYGTAINILNRYGDHDAARIVKGLYKEKLSLVLKYQNKITSSTRRRIPRW